MHGMRPGQNTCLERLHIEWLAHARNGVSARSGDSFEHLLANASVELIPTPRKIRNGFTPDERYLAAELGFLRDWNPMENLAYPNP